MLLLLAILIATSPAAQSLEDEAGVLLNENKFEAALGTLEAANRIEETPARLLLIARCHREIAYARVREAARLQPTEAVMREMAKSLDDLDQSRTEPVREHADLAPAPAVQPRPIPAPVRNEIVVQPPRPYDKRVAALAAGAGSVVLFVAAGLAHAHASGMTSQLSDPNVPDKGAVQQSINDWQTGSSMLVGAGLVLAATGVFLWRF